MKCVLFLLPKPAATCPRAPHTYPRIKRDMSQAPPYGRVKTQEAAERWLLRAVYRERGPRRGSQPQHAATRDCRGSRAGAHRHRHAHGRWGGGGVATSIDVQADVREAQDPNPRSRERLQQGERDTASRIRQPFTYPNVQGGIYDAKSSTDMKYMTGITKEEVDQFYANTYLDTESDQLERPWLFRQARNNLGEHAAAGSSTRRTIRGSMSDNDRVMICWLETLRRDIHFEEMSLKYRWCGGT